MERSERLIGGARGLEHVVFPVRDLGRSTEDFRRELGFSISPGLPHADGTIDGSIMFHDDTYIELLGIHDPSRDTPIVREVQRFLEKREGPVTVGVRVSSATQVATFLRGRGFEVNGPVDTTFPDPVTGKPSPPMYSNVEISTRQPYWSDLIFFNEKIEGNWEKFVATSPEAAAMDRASVKQHANSAIRLASVWLAVDDLEQALEAWSSIGADAETPREFPPLDAVGVELVLGLGSLLILRARSPDGPVAGFLSRHREAAAMIGISVEVRDLEIARRAVSRHVLARPDPYAGWFGRSLLISPEHAHGAWLELFSPFPDGPDSPARTG